MEAGRINIAARAVGVATAAFEEAIRYAQRRETFGKPIAQHQAIQTMLAEMATKIRAARLLTYDAAARKDRGERCDEEGGMAKLFASEVCGPGDAGRHADTRRVRVHQGPAVGAVLPGRAAYDYRGRDQRDTEANHRPQPVASVRSLGGALEEVESE